MRGVMWILAWTLASCGGNVPPPGSADAPRAPAPSAVTPGTFGDDLAFLRAHTGVVVLEAEDGRAQVVVAPEYQGRVLTSTASGEAGASFGWINREVIAEKKRQPHMNVFGGEDRFWLGPEGGQYGLYFPPGASFDLEHWQVPEAIDWGAWDVTASAAGEVTFQKDMRLTNYTGAEFSVRVDRKVALLGKDVVAKLLGMAIPAGASVVAYESTNTITNTGSTAWSKEKGLVSVWILGMYQPSAETTVVLPFRAGSEAELGPVVNDAYFGKVPSARLQTTDRLVFFRGDGQERGKIGIPRRRAVPLAASYDASRGVLTLVEYTLPESPGAGYVNSMWEEQKEPYGGDVVNSYNDGPPGPGKKPLGPFYELETSSPAAALGPGESLTHVHRTIHLEGAASVLDPVALAKLGVNTERIRTAFGAK